MAALNYARYIPIVNFSAGKDYPLPTLLQAISQYPGLFVCSAGNDYRNSDLYPKYPAYYTRILNNVISVGAIDANGNRVDFSNYGPTTVDVFAPGYDIYTVTSSGSYGPTGGTSFSAPMVAGVAALLKSLHPDMTAQGLKFALLSRSVVNERQHLLG